MCHALVIEDEWLIAEYVGSLAEQAGATSVDFAENEADAIAAAKRRVPAIILSDVQIRAGTGPNAVEAIHREFGPIPVIFITGTPEECHPCAPPAVVLGKPIRQEEILAEFRRLAPIA